jgi:hypothetical protein
MPEAWLFLAPEAVPSESPLEIFVVKARRINAELIQANEYEGVIGSFLAVAL